MEQNPPKIDWLHGTPREAVAEYALWLDAVVSAEIPKGAEVGGNLKPLIGLLRSDHIPKPEARAAIADLLSRHRLARLPGKQATPHRRKHRRRKGPEDKAVLAANLKPLIELLRNPARVLGPNARADIADLLSRHRLMRLPYRPSAPRYGTTLAEGRMDMLASAYRWHRRKLPEDEAILAALRDEKREKLGVDGFHADVTEDELLNAKLDEIIREEGSEEALTLRIKGRRGSSRRRPRP